MSSTGPGLSAPVISKRTDAAMGGSGDANGSAAPGISIRYGPVDDEDSAMADAADGVNGRAASKRKSRLSAGKKSYMDPESSEDDKPLVCISSPRECIPRILIVLTTIIEQAPPNCESKNCIRLGRRRSSSSKGKRSQVTIGFEDRYRRGIRLRPSH
jgi:hypothetical protein